jgi:predicted AAA+ superfamily ATPase
MIPRQASPLVRERLQQYPAVALVGPRQAGKTTLARALGGVYFDLEQEGDRTRLDVQWERLVAGDNLLVLDEAQTCPAVFPRLRGAIDADRKRVGRFLLLGSVSPSLMAHVSESLAGRLGLVELTPLLLTELPRWALEDRWLRGGFADGGVLVPSRFPQWQLDYLDLLAQRDLPAWGLPAKPGVTSRLLRMVAVLHGQLWNASQVGQGLGLSHPTVNSYLQHLEGVFLIRRLQPFTANLRKRLIRTPKIYWRDSGLLHALLRCSTMDELLGHPLAGASWEGFVIEQLLGTLAQWGQRTEPFFLRTSDGYEVDLLLEVGKELWAIEVKLTSQPSPADLARLNKAADFVRADKRILITQTARSAIEKEQMSCNLPALLKWLAESA